MIYSAPFAASQAALMASRPSKMGGSGVCASAAGSSSRGSLGPVSPGSYSTIAPPLGVTRPAGEIQRRRLFARQAIVVTQNGECRCGLRPRAACGAAFRGFHGRDDREQHFALSVRRVSAQRQGDEQREAA